MPSRLAAETIDDRVRRYLTSEPLALIARDHGVTINALYETLKRYAPNVVASRPRGGGRREWPA